MIIDISKPINIVCSEPFRVERTNLQQAAIDNNWKEFIKDKNPADFFNGEVFLVNNIIFDENEYVLEVGSSRYADLVYAKETGKLKVRSLFVASYIVTSDGFLCVIKNKRNRINTIGGMADDSDFLNGQFQPWKCLIREWEEEMGVNLETDSRFGEVNKRFLKIPGRHEENISLYPVGILYEVQTSLSRQELIDFFNNRKIFTDGEICKLLFYDNKTYLTLEQENAEGYIYEMFTHLFNFTIK